MKSVFNILSEIESIGSTNEKMRILKENSSNLELKEFFRLCLDKQLNFYVKIIPQYNTMHTDEITLSDAMASLSNLSDRVYTGKKATTFVSILLTKCSAENAEVIKRIIKRDPSCGVSFTSANKVWDDLIAVWPCHLCERSTEKNLSNIKYPAIVQEKSDGMRMNIVYVDDNITYRSRNGSIVDIYGVLDEEVKRFKKHVEKNFVLDGEALVLDENGNITDRQTGNGIMNKAIQGTITKEESERIIINIWDCIDYDTFSKKQKGYVDYIFTMKQINRICKTENFKKIFLINTKIVETKDQALKFYKLMLEKGKEGAILKNQDSKWEDTRSKDNVKLKIEKDVDLKVIGTFPHKKKPNWIGGFTCISSDGKVKVNVGSGLKDSDRKADPITFMHKIITVRSNGLIESKQKEEFSLFLPRYIEIRLDKDVADSLEDIKNIFESFLKEC